MIYTFPDGRQVDLSSGQFVGQQAAEQLTSPEARQQKMEIAPVSAKQGAVDALNQLSWNFNAALFALPDAAIKKVGQALNVADEEIPTFVRFFNRGQTAPKNAVERYSAAIGQGMGATLPFTGLLGAFARTRALTGPLAPDAPITKQVAKEMLDFIRQNPKLAVATDLGFGAVYGATEQAVEEMAPEGPQKELMKQTIPFAVTVGAPAVGASILNVASKLATLSPTLRIAKNTAKEVPNMFGSQTAEGYAEEVVDQTIPKIPLLGGPLRWAGRKYATTAENRVQEVLAPLLADPSKAPPGVREALEVTRAIETDPRLAGRFLFTAGEQSLYGPFLQAQNQMVKNLSGKLLTAEQQRAVTNEESLLRAFEIFAPSAAMPLDEALRVTYAQSAKTVDDALKRVQGLADDEALRIADTFVTQNLDEIGDSLRRSVLAQMEGNFYNLRKKSGLLGMRTGFDVEGVRTPVRTEEGIPTLPAVEAKDFIESFKKRFQIPAKQRLFPEDVPSPVRMIEREERRLQENFDNELDTALRSILDKDLKANNSMYNNVTEPERKRLLDDAVSQTLALSTEKRAALGPGVQNEIKRAKSMVSQATEIAKARASINMTAPEALDLLESALKFRNSSFIRANKELDLGNPRRNAQALIDRGDAVLRDVENFVFKSFKESPEMQAFMESYKDTYSKGYEKLFPLMITKRSAAGDFYVNNEKVIDKALSSAENVRTLNTIFGDSPEYIGTLKKVMFDRAAKTAGVLKDGVMNVNGYNAFLSKNRNLIDAMPESVQTSLRDELRFGSDFAARMKDMKDRADLANDEELFSLLKKSIRPDADPRQLVDQAVRDPAVMRKLVTTVGSDPDRLEALRRQVWTSVREDLLDPAKPLFLEDFIKKNGKSLNILFDKQHLDDLNKLSEIQRRVFIAARPEGTLTPFQSLDEQLRERFGAGVGTIESTARAAMIRQISPFHAAVSLLTRFLTRRQTAIYESVLYKALTDPEYAHQLVNAREPIENNKSFNTMNKLTWKAGGFLPSLLRAAPRAGTLEVTEEFVEPIERPITEVAPEAISPQPVPQAAARPELQRAPLLTPGQAVQRLMAPAPLRELTQSPVVRALPRMPSQQQISGQQYQALFPNDPLAPLIQQRRP